MQDVQNGLKRPTSLIARWKGTAWRRMPVLGADGEVNGVAVTSGERPVPLGSLVKRRPAQPRALLHHAHVELRHARTSLTGGP